MQRNEKDSEWWIIWIGIMIGVMSSHADSQAVRPGDTSQARARAIIARHDSATGRIGGRSQLRYTHMISETETPTKAVTETWTMAPNRMLTRMTVPGSGTVEIGYNGSVGWTISPLTGPVLIEGEQLKFLAKQAEGRGPTDAAFKTLSVGARTVLEGKEVMPVAFEDDQGNVGTFYFDTKTGLFHAVRVNSAGSAGADATILTLAGDYKRIDGELYAMTTTVSSGGNSIVTRTTHVDHTLIDTALFTPPAEVRALLKRP